MKHRDSLARWCVLAVALALVACTKSAPPAPAGAVAPGPASPVAPPVAPAPVEPAAPEPVPSVEPPAAALVDCTPSKVLCRRRAPECPAGEVPSVAGSCFGPCVPIARCACTEATQCPQPEQHTCWKKQHCGPFVR